MFVNVKGKVITVQGGDREGNGLIMGKRTYSWSQRFTVTYTDKEEKIATSGVSGNFGFHIGKPFYIITRMGSGRAVEIRNGKNLVLRWRKYKSVSQQFYFDNGTKTIKSV
jgi:hypothetical protein